ncbi:hypothetical protein EJ06DRAFT_533659 [Trichodelitschia bisporula]|uniref:Uncharacterized protein n=1 Tax=Trichodelitschia bisporula TaxID=703511 RepID=A0A6G1HM59_9PEZI|nr:hypothetical protein EJ06DRAFT_533659 [Trichodelitschia bisporula]
MLLTLSHCALSLSLSLSLSLFFLSPLELSLSAASFTPSLLTSHTPSLTLVTFPPPPTQPLAPSPFPLGELRPGPGLQVTGWLGRPFFCPFSGKCQATCLPKETSTGSVRNLFGRGEGEGKG